MYVIVMSVLLKFKKTFTFKFGFLKINSVDGMLHLTVEHKLLAFG